MVPITERQDNVKNLTIMIKPASSLCDMACSYCFYSDVSASRSEASLGIMEKAVAASVIRNIFSELEAGDSVTFAFQGGEPSIAGLDYFTFFADTAQKAASPRVKINYALQTNGLMIDEAWCRFFKAHKFLIGLSLDGDAAIHNKNRADNTGKGTFNRVTEAKKLLDKHRIDYNILSVLTAESSRRAVKLWDFIVKQGIRYIQFIPCLEPLLGQSASALTSGKFYHFYSNLFPLWKKEAANGNLVSIKLFEDLAVLHLTGQPVTCGLSGRCKPQIIVEADGSVYPCDFYVLDEYRLSDLTKSSIREVFDAVVNSDFLKESAGQPVYCENCAYKAWCGGGCKRMAKAVYGENCGMRMFLDECLSPLLAVYRRYYNG